MSEHPSPAETAWQAYAAERAAPLGVRPGQISGRTAFLAGFEAAEMAQQHVWLLFDHRDFREAFATETDAKARAEHLLSNAEPMGKHICDSRCFDVFREALHREVPS